MQSLQNTMDNTSSTSSDESDVKTSTVTIIKGKKKKKSKPNVLFIGNLPYNTTKEEIMEHFKKAGGSVTDVRLITDKNTGQSRGFGYVDFDNFESVRKGLKLHHSRIFGRKINVEMTVPGRGRSENRKGLIREKNKQWKRKLNKKKRPSKK
uniref:Uncharacterized RNA-binding protein C365.04c-like isoform X1 n=2 Tax=Saccoglossus kowalevskii TaxID=10224 RepID=A0ABM0MVH7_SACKO|nr:PREDICTED: uncharacterized RNA-binding protein C365.04c-like isoform X1 [Saccoglossus kowalevskii]